MIAKKEHKLQGSQLQLKYVEHIQEEIMTYSSDDTLEVSNLPSGTSEDILELYFESPRSGGYDGAVKSVAVIQPGVAHIQFTSTKSEQEYY